jgi:hypothetical protein
VLSLRGVALAVVLGALQACGKPVAHEECSALLDRYVEKLVGSDRPELGAGDLLRLQAEARATADSDPAFRDCTSADSRRLMDCAMRADTLDRWVIWRM